MRELRKALMFEVAKLPRKGVGIALSGGVDSCSLLAACLAVGVRPTVISYTPHTHESTDYQYARSNATLLGLPFHGVSVDVRPRSLEYLARFVIRLGYRTKMQVESLAPMVRIAEAANSVGVQVLITGDQADGYYINGNWISRNYDRAQGIPGPLRQHVKTDLNAVRIDELRRIYWEEDRGNCAAVQAVCAEYSVSTAMPYRTELVRKLFAGKHWREVNEPRLKEPAWQAFPELRTDTVNGIWTRKTPVNLHRGDSEFSETMGRTLLSRFPQYKTPLGVYGGMARGEI